MNISHWLRKAPQPVAIMADAQRIEVPKNARAWRDLTATIEAMEPSKLTALDAAGNVIRSIVLESDDGKEPTRSEMASDLQLFARLLAEGYEKGQKANQPIIDSAMAMLERHGSRLARAEAECDRLRAVIHRQQLQIAGAAAAPADGGDDSLLSKIMAGALQAGALGAVGGNGANVSAIKPGLKK